MITRIDAHIKVDNPEQHDPVLFTDWSPMLGSIAMKVPHHITDLEVTYRRDIQDLTRWVANSVKVARATFVHDYDGLVGTCNTSAQTYPLWVAQLVADHNPGAVTDAMVEAALGSHTCACTDMRTAITAALQAQVGTP